MEGDYITCKEIGKLCGMTERSVQGWVNKAGEKIASAGHGIYADYDLDETVKIVRIGMEEAITFGKVRWN